MNFKNPFKVTQADLAQREIDVVKSNLDRLQALADHHRNLADQYQAGVEMIRGLKEPETVEDAAVTVPTTTTTPTPIRRSAR